ncbi:MAG TPA: hypothetical protein VFQ89_05730, partial [Candidatus Binatia bacterium]|nr:hypothetical protein [Candidatus Binatia bacterium]
SIVTNAGKRFKSYKFHILETSFVQNVSTARMAVKRLDKYRPRAYLPRFNATALDEKIMVV